MKNMKISAKLLSGFLIVALFAAIVGVVGIYGMSRLESQDTLMYEGNVLAIDAISTMRETYQKDRVRLRNLIVYIGVADLQPYVDETAVLEETFRVAAEEYIKSMDPAADESAFYAARDSYFGEYATIKKAIEDAAVRGDKQEATDLLHEATVIATGIAKNLETSGQLNSQWAKETTDGNTALFRQLRIILIAVIAVAVVVSILLGIYISRLLSPSMICLSSALEQVGMTGDLNLPPELAKKSSQDSKRKDEIGKAAKSLGTMLDRLHYISDELETVASGDLTSAVNVVSDKDTMGNSLVKMNESLNSMFGDINHATSQVAAGSKQIADGASALAQGSTQQAAAVEQLSASIAQVAEITKENAKMATKAATLGNTIKSDAEKGNGQMNHMMSAVSEINEASQSINKVIKVIDDIAFQTNILALNAAVEAARAGQHGKGFAVVAEEVRSLAAKSAEAAKDTGSLIANSMEKAELGSKIAQETSESLKQIVSGINESSQIVSDIARSSDEQTASILQINDGINQVAQVVQQNSSTAEESAAASQEMSSQSNMLEELVGQFQLKGAGRDQRQLKGRRAATRALNGESSQESGENFGEGFGKY